MRRTPAERHVAEACDMLEKIPLHDLEHFRRRIFLAGVSCVGKTTIGPKLAALLGYRFFDLDVEIERFYEMPIDRLQNSYRFTNSDSQPHRS
jgi:shikimate kinase